MSATLVLGATGGTGLAFVEQSLALSPSAPLVLYVRSPHKLPQHLHHHRDNVRVVVGDLRDEAALHKAMAGVQAVVCFLGAYMSFTNIFIRNTDTPLGDALPGVFRAMKLNSVKRFLVLSTASAWVLPGDKKTFKWNLATTFPDLMVPQGHAEMYKLAAQTAAQADLDWTIFRVMFLTSGPADLPVHAAPELTPHFPGGVAISRASIARWVLGELAHPQWIRAAPMISN